MEKETYKVTFRCNDELYDPIIVEVNSPAQLSSLKNEISKYLRYVLKLPNYASVDIDIFNAEKIKESY